MAVPAAGTPSGGGARDARTPHGAAPRPGPAASAAAPRGRSPPLSAPPRGGALAPPRAARSRRARARLPARAPAAPLPSRRSRLGAAAPAGDVAVAVATAPPPCAQRKWRRKPAPPPGPARHLPPGPGLPAPPGASRLGRGQHLPGAAVCPAGAVPPAAAPWLRAVLGAALRLVLTCFVFAVEVPTAESARIEKNVAIVLGYSRWPLRSQKKELQPLLLTSLISLTGFSHTC